MRKYLPLTILLATGNIVFAQKEFKQNTIYGEMFGNGIGIVSVNYERQLKARPGFGFRLGLGYYDADSEFRLSIPIGMNYLFDLSKNRSFIEAGAGFTWSNAEGMAPPKNGVLVADEDENIISFIPSVGYRAHIINDKIMLRASIPVIINKYRTFPYLGLAAGIRF